MGRGGSRLGIAIIAGIIGAITLGGGLIFLVRGADSSTFRCERASGECTQTIGNRLDTTTRRIALAEAGQARVGARTVQRRPFYQAEIPLSNGGLVLLGGSSRDASEQRATADRFNRFLGSQQTPTYTHTHAAPSVLFFGLAWIACGAVFATVAYRQFRRWRRGE